MPLRAYLASARRAGSGKSAAGACIPELLIKQRAIFTYKRDPLVKGTKLRDVKVGSGVFET